MKALLISLSLLLLLSLSAFATDKQITGKQIVDIDITGMSCKFCAHSVQKSLTALPGVEKAEVNIDDNKAHVVMADGQQADIEQIKKNIIESGFNPAKITISHSEK